MELQISHHLEALNLVYYLFIYLFFLKGGGGGRGGGRQAIQFPVAFRRAILKTFWGKTFWKREWCTKFIF